MLAAVMSSRDCFMVSSATAAWASKLSGFSAWAFTNNMPLIGWDLNARFARFFPDFMLYEGELSLPWQIIFYLAVGPVVMVGVSLFTKPQAKKKLDRVYVCLRTPVLPGEPEVEPLTLPGGTNPPPRTALVKHPDFEIMKPTLAAVVGFLVSCLGVGLLIAHSSRL